MSDGHSSRGSPQSGWQVVQGQPVPAMLPVIDLLNHRSVAPNAELKASKASDFGPASIEAPSAPPLAHSHEAGLRSAIADVWDNHYECQGYRHASLTKRS